MWGVVTPQEATAKIEEQKKDYIARKQQERDLPTDALFEAQNLEEQAISLIGTDIYEKLIKGYTEKQWGRPCTELPSFIIKRLPVRLTFDNNYFNALYQGIPVGGYTKMVEKMLDGIEVRLNEDYLKSRENWNQLAEKVIFTGPIDAYYDYRLGTLEYRSVRFETEHQVRRLYGCDRGGVSGMADADYFEDHPIQAAVLVVSYIHANYRESGPYQFDEFLNKYETIFEYPDENNAADEVRNYIDKLSSIVKQYI